MTTGSSAVTIAPSNLLLQDLGVSDLEATSPASYVALDNSSNDSQTSSPAPSSDGENDYGDDSNEDTIAPDSVVSSVLTAEGIHDPTGFACVSLVILIGDMARGVMFPSMWPLVEALGGTHVTLGYAVAAFSFGRILVNPLFGSWSHTLGYTTTLLISCSILFLGTVLYAQVWRVGRAEFLIVAQTVLGVGSGTLGVTRAFVADVTDRKHRTIYMAWVSAVQYAGFTVTPLIGALFNYCYRHQDLEQKTEGIFHFNMFTTPAYFMGFMVASTLIILLIYFQDRHRVTIHKTTDNKNNKKSPRRQHIEETASTKTAFGLTIYDCCILGCMLLNVATQGSIASFETMGVAVAQSHFLLLSRQAGLVVGLCGAVGVCSLLSMGQLSVYFSDVQLVGGGLFIMATGVALLTSLHDLVDDQDKNPLWKYSVSIFLIYSVGYPVSHTAVIGIFSKIIGRRPQGTLLGWFVSAGSLARMIFPVMSGYIAKHKNVQTLFMVLVLVLVSATIFVGLARQKLSLLSS